MKQRRLFVLLLSCFATFFHSAEAQTCQSCPQAFSFSDSIRCTFLDVVRIMPAGYTTNRPVNACKNSRDKYILTPSSPSCYSGITYSVVSISGGTLISLVNNQLTIQWSSANIGNFVLAFTAPNGFGVQPCTDTITINFHLVNDPFAAFTASPQPACFNNPTFVSFNSSLSVNSVGYYWDFGDGFTSTQANPTHAYSAAGTYIVSLIVTNALSINGQPSCPYCTDAVQHPITIDNTPGPDIGCVATVCAGSTATYCTSATSCAQYTWMITGGTITGGQNTACINVLWGTGTPQGTINLVVTGCAAAACTQGTTVNVPIIPVSGIISGPPSPVCINSNVVYSLPSWAGTTYNWAVSGGGVINSYNTNTGQVSVNWLAAGNYTVNCNYFDSSLGCGGTASLTVFVRAGMAITGPATTCQYSSSTLNALTTGNAPVLSNWTITPVGATIVSGNGTGTINIIWPSPGIYSVNATAVTPNLVCSDASFLVTVLAAPVISSIIGADSICPNQTNVYTAVSNAVGTFTWVVSNGTAVNLGSNNDSVQVTWNASGPFSISVSQGSYPGGCRSNTFAKNIFAYPTPLVSGAASVCADDIENYTITNISTGNFQWSVYPPSFGTILSGQGTQTVQIDWHGNNNPGFPNVVHLHFGVCGTDSLAITINEPTAATITATGSLCIGGVTLSTGATGTFFWSCAEHPIVPTPGNTPAITVSESGHYHVQIQNNNGTGCTVNADYFLPNSGAPLAHISAAGPLLYCLPALPNLTLVANNAPGYSFQWFTGNTPVGTGPTFVVNNLTTAGTYVYYCVVSLGTCTDTSNVVTITIVTCDPSVGPCANATLDVTGISGCNPFTFSIAAAAPAGATLNTPLNPSVTEQEDNITENSLTTSAYTSTGYKHVTVCADILLADHVTICRACKDTVVLVNAAANFTGNIGCRMISLFDASTTISPTVINSYSWQVGFNPGNSPVPPAIASFNANTIANPVLSINQSGSYIVTLTLNTTGCVVSHSDTFNISVPNADFIVGNSCAGTAITFNNITPASTNFWDFGDAATSYISPTFHAYATAGNYVATHIVTDANGCRDTVHKNVLISAAPVCTISYTGPVQFCFGDSLLLHACAGYSDYQWYNNGTPIIGSVDAADTVIQTGNYSFTATAPGGCRVVSDTIAVTVSQPPNTNIITSGSHCNGSNLVAFVQPCTGCFYQWNLDGVPIANGNQVSGTVGNAPLTIGSHNLTVIVTNAAGCTDSSSGSQTFYALPSVSISVAGNLAQLCSNNIYNLTATTNAANPAFAWLYNSVPPILSASNSINASATGNYLVTVTDGLSGCMGSSVQPIEKSPDLALFPTGCDTLCDTSHVYLPLPSFSGNVSGYTIDWYDNAPPYASIGSGVSFPLSSLLDGPHNFSVIVTGPNGCIDTSNVYSVVTVNCRVVVALREIIPAVKQVNALALVSWTVNQETEDDYFVAERSADGTNFLFAAKLPSRGYNSSAQQYSVYDPITYYNKPVWYRIKSVAKNGSFTYSVIVKLLPLKTAEESIVIVPSVTTGPTAVIIQSNVFCKTDLVVYATDGKLMMHIPVSLSKGSNLFHLDLGSFSSGLYFVEATISGMHFTAKCIRE